MHSVKSPGMNRLSLESSPYLRQHAANPVDWFPWNEAAFLKAASEDKPIFLSIGYSTCHWCHVMAHESFEDAEVAALLNRYFVCIKVDREERPDIDQLYMSVATNMLGRGGWPLTIVMRPDKRPFFAGTYFSKHSQSGRIGLLDLLPRIYQAWVDQRAEIESTADQIIASLQTQNDFTQAAAQQPDLLDRALQDFSRQYDDVYGGFGSAPKFPSPHTLIFLLRESKRRQDPQPGEMALNTLRQMRLGGMFDQIGFGFHRYSTDKRWHLPHFEKMLYDQAMLMWAYTEAWQLSGEAIFQTTVAEIFQYLQQRLKADEGGYYSAEDADSEGEEGKFYVWSYAELQRILGDSELQEIAPLLSIQPEGNFVEEATGRAMPLNILHISSMAAYHSLREHPEWPQVRKQMDLVREGRIRPGLDDKILTDWNGLLLIALSRAASVFGDPRYGQAAESLGEFLLTECRDDAKGLLHLPASASNTIPGFVDDYSFVIAGLRSLYEVNFDVNILAQAIHLQEEQIQRFSDSEAPGFFFSQQDGEPLFMRQKELYDGALPSGNSMAVVNLLALGRLTMRSSWVEMAEQSMTATSAQVSRAPRGFAALLLAFQWQAEGGSEIVIAGSRRELASAGALLNMTYDPFRIVLFREQDAEDKLIEIAPFTRSQKSINGGLTVYICENYSCRTPLVGMDDLEQVFYREAAAHGANSE